MKPPARPSAYPGVSAPRETLLDRVRTTGLADELLDEIEVRVRRRKVRRRAALRAAAAAVAVMAGLFGGIVPYVRETATIATAPGQRQGLTLADGSRADLNARTSVHTDFRYGRRTVRLDQGEAYFAVAKDAAHPFLVLTPAGTVRVTGTHFNVRLAAPDRVEVTLLEGAVEFQDAAGTGTEPVRLRPGQQLLSGQPARRTLSPAEMNDVIAWREGRLVLDGLTLAEAGARFAAYHGKQIDVASAVASLRPGGSCALDDLAQFMEILKATHAVQVLALPDGGYRILPAGAK